MASSNRLTWQNVTAPDFTAAANTQKYASEALNKALGRVSNIVTDFDNNRKDAADAAVLRNAMQYQNADELQRAIASGQLMNGVNPDHVRVDALLKAQAQASNLMALDRDRQQLATSKQTFDFNEPRNPLLIEGDRLANKTAEQTLSQTAELHPSKVALANTQANAAAFNLGKDQHEFGRKEEDYNANLAATKHMADLRSRGVLDDPQAVSQVFSSLNMSDPVHRALAQQISTAFPDLVKPISAPGSYTGQPTQIPTGTLAGIGGATQGNVLGMALYGQESNFGQARTDYVNEHGVTGPMQVQDVTWREMQRLNIIPKEWDHKNPEQNKEAGFRWADHLTRKHGGDLSRAAAEYYGGPKAVNSDGTINRDRRDLKNPKAPTVGQYVDQVMQRVANQAPGSVPQATTQPAARPTAATMGIPQATNAAAPAQNAPSTPTADAPAANQLSPENAAILARITQQTLGLGQSAGNTAELSSFAAAAADKKTTFAEARKSIVDANPGLDPRDVDSMLTQVQAMHPMLRNPAAAAYVINNTPKTSAWYDPFNWGNNIRMDPDAIEAKAAELTHPDAVRTGILTNEVSANIGAKVAEAEKNLTATTDNILTLQEQLRNAAPDSARARALQSEITRMEGKAAQYRDQIDTRAAQEEALTEQVMRAANPELFAKQQREAEQRKAAAAAADAAMTKKTAAPAEPEVRVPSWKRSMTKAEVEELKRYEEFKKRDTRERTEAAKRAEQEAKARTEAESQKEAAAITVDAIRNMTQEQINKINTSRAFSKLTKEQRNALITRHFQLRGG